MPRAVLERTVPPHRGNLLPARVSPQPARGPPHATAGRSCGWKERPPGRAGQGPSDVKRVLCGSGLLTAPDHSQHMSQGTSQEAHQGRGYLEGKVLSRVCAFPVSCDGGAEIWSWSSQGRTTVRDTDSITAIGQHLFKEPDKVPSLTSASSSGGKGVTGAKSTKQTPTVLFCTQVNWEWQGSNLSYITGRFNQ